MARSRCRTLVLVAALLGLGPLGAVAQAQNVLLGLGGGGVHYHLESFGRRVDVRLRFFTGEPTLELCSAVDPEGVVLELTFPAGTSFVSESYGGAVVDPIARTVTWNLGTLNALANCFGTGVVVTLDVDGAVPGGTMLTATASISTTTAGDDPSNNAGSLTFQGGMLPLEVFMETSSNCRAGSDDASSDVGERLTCAGSDAGILPAEASSTVEGMGPPRKLGELRPPSGVIETPKLTVRARSDGGFDCDSTLTSCWPLSVFGEATGELDVDIQNPNPFDVPLHWRRDSFAHAGCSDNDALFPGEAYVEDSIPTVECGSSFSNRFPFGDLSLDCDGLSGTCVQDFVVTTDEPSESHQSFNSSAGLVPAFGRRGLASLFGSGDADGDSNVFDFGDLILIRSGYGYYSAATRTRIALAGGGLLGGAREIRFVAESPVDLLVTDEAGERTGVDRDAAPPDPGAQVDPLLGQRTVAEIAGSRYSGPASEPEEVVIGLPDPGKYRLQIFGTGDGPFRITVESRAFDGPVISQHVLTGDATQETSLSQGFLLDADGSVTLVVPEPVPCDIDSDGDVDRNDISLILDTRNTAASGTDDPRDRDGDGMITVLDARKCALECTLPRCAAN